MKKWSILLGFFLFHLVALAQEPADMVYRRSSLTVSFIDDFSNLNRQERSLIEDIIESYKVPDKYNEHQVTDRLIDLSKIVVSKDDTKPYEKKLGGKLLDVLLPSEVKATFGYVDVSEEDPVWIARINKYMSENHVPGYMVAKWFNMSNNRVDDSFFNMDLIMERGAYNATTLDRLRSDESLRKKTLLMDAGMDLIPNTFSIMIRLHYMSAKEWNLMMAERMEGIADDYERKAKGESKSLGGGHIKINIKNESNDTQKKEENLESARRFRSSATEYRKSAETEKGYFISATTYLYQLVWNTSISDAFLKNSYLTDNPRGLIDSNQFRIKYLGRSNCQVRTSAFSLLDAPEMIKKATIRSIDKTFAKLQQKYEDFAVKAPIIDVTDTYATAFIGTKEGINGKSKFDVLELQYNEKKGVYRYVSVGSLSVDKAKIWDNLYGDESFEMMSDEEENEEKEVGSRDIDRSYFKGVNSKIAPGMIIRQK